MNGYDLSRNYFAFKFENPNKLKANHTELYFYIVDLWNRLGQKQNIGLPTAITMECLGIGSYNTYKKILSELVETGLIILVSESKNQYQSKVIALSNFDKALDKALDKATAKARDEAPDKAVDSINKPRTSKPRTKKTIVSIPEFSEFKEYGLLKQPDVSLEGLKRKYESWVENGWKDGFDNKITNWKSKLLNTLPYIEKQQTKKVWQSPA